MDRHTSQCDNTSRFLQQQGVIFFLAVLVSVIHGVSFVRLLAEELQAGILESEELLGTLSATVGGSTVPQIQGFASALQEMTTDVQEEIQEMSR